MTSGEQAFGLHTGDIVGGLVDLLGAGRDETFGPVHVDVPPDAWHSAVAAARSLGASYFDFLTAVAIAGSSAEEAADGLEVVCHLVSPGPPIQQVMLRTEVPHGTSLVSVATIYAGAGWHEREVAEMFGLSFHDEAGEVVPPRHLLLDEGFEGHPLRKDFLLASRLDRAWPGAKEAGESDATAVPSRRRMRPPGVPEGWTPGAPR